MPTYEDTYTIAVNLGEKGVRENVRIYEIGGRNATIAQHFVASCDAAIVVYDYTDFESFLTAKKIKSNVGVHSPFRKFV